VVDLDRSLAQVSRRLRLQRALRLGLTAAAWSTPLAIGVGVAHVVGFDLGLAPLPWLVALPPLAIGAIGALVGAWRPVSPQVAAAVLEQRAGCGFLFSTALELRGGHGWSPLVEREVASALETVETRRAVPVRLPRAARALAGGLLLAGGLVVTPPYTGLAPAIARETASLSDDDRLALTTLGARLERTGAEHDAQGLVEAARRLDAFAEQAQAGELDELEALALLGDVEEELRRERARVDARGEARRRLGESQALEAWLQGARTGADTPFWDDAERRAEARQALERSAEAAEEAEAPELAQALRDAAEVMDTDPEAATAKLEQVERELAELPAQYADDLTREEVERAFAELEQVRETLTEEAPEAEEEAEAETEVSPEASPDAETEGGPGSQETRNQPDPPSDAETEVSPEASPDAEAGEERGSQESGDQPDPSSESDSESEPEPGSASSQGADALQGLAEDMLEGMDPDTLRSLLETMQDMAPEGAEPPAPPEDLAEQLKQLDPELLRKVAEAAAGLEPPPGVQPPELSPELQQQLENLDPATKRKLQEALEGLEPPQRPGQPGEGQPQGSGDETRAGQTGDASADPTGDPSQQAGTDGSVGTGEADRPQRAEGDDSVAGQAEADDAAQTQLGGSGDSVGSDADTPPEGRQVLLPSRTERAVGEVAEGPAEAERDGERRVDGDAGGVYVPFGEIPDSVRDEAEAALSRQRVPESYERVVREYFRHRDP
jgi:hypothetical protein